MTRWMRSRTSASVRAKDDHGARCRKTCRDRMLGCGLLCVRGQGRIPGVRAVLRWFEIHLIDGRDIFGLHGQDSFRALH